jgi:hypothetical protein
MNPYLMYDVYEQPTIDIGSDYGSGIPSVADLKAAAKNAGTRYVDAVDSMYGGLAEPGRRLKAQAGRVIGRGGRRMAGNAAGLINKVPGMAKAGAILGVAAPALGAVGGVIGAGDIVLGDDSLANKGMDTLGMGIGGFLGAAGGPLGIAAGAGIGKAVSDGAQFLLGGGQSAEERQLAEALLALKAGVI